MTEININMFVLLPLCRLARGQSLSETWIESQNLEKTRKNLFSLAGMLLNPQKKGNGD